MSDYPKLIFQYEFGEREQFEAQSRGYLSHVFVELSNKKKYPVVFYDRVRLAQDLEEELKLGNKFIAEPGLIILPEVTIENMLAAINRLEKERYFDSFVPCRSPIMDSR